MDVMRPHWNAVTAFLYFAFAFTVATAVDEVYVCGGNLFAKGTPLALAGGWCLQLPHSPAYYSYDAPTRRLGVFRSQGDCTRNSFFHTHRRVVLDGSCKVVYLTGASPGRDTLSLTTRAPFGGCFPARCNDLRCELKSAEDCSWPCRYNTARGECREECFELDSTACSASPHCSDRPITCAPPEQAPSPDPSPSLGQTFLFAPIPGTPGITVLHTMGFFVMILICLVVFSLECCCLTKWYCKDRRQPGIIIRLKETVAVYKDNQRETLWSAGEEIREALRFAEEADFDGLRSAERTCRGVIDAAAKAVRDAQRSEKQATDLFTAEQSKNAALQGEHDKAQRTIRSLREDNAVQKATIEAYKNLTAALSPTPPQGDSAGDRSEPSKERAHSEPRNARASRARTPRARSRSALRRERSGGRTSSSSTPPRQHEAPHFRPGVPQGDGGVAVGSNGGGGAAEGVEPRSVTFSLTSPSSALRSNLAPSPSDGYGGGDGGAEQRTITPSPSNPFTALLLNPAHSSPTASAMQGADGSHDGPHGTLHGAAVTLPVDLQPIPPTDTSAPPASDHAATATYEAPDGVHHGESDTTEPWRYSDEDSENTVPGRRPRVAASGVSGRVYAD